MSEGSTLLSVVIPCYDAADVLPRSLASLAGAARAGVEVVVVDDGSTDDTPAVLAAWSDYPVVVLRQANAGPCVARNTGLASAGGRFVAFLDGDDEVAPGWHDFFLSLARAPDDVVLATCGVRVVDQAGRVEVRSPRDLGPAYEGLRALLLPGAYAVARDVLVEAGGFDPGVPYGEHHELGLRIAPRLARGRHVVTSEPLVTKHHDRGAGRVQDYARARLTAAQVVLTRHAPRLRQDPVMRGDYHAVASHAAHLLGDRRSAVRHATLALTCRPLRLRSWGRLVRAAVPHRAATS